MSPDGPVSEPQTREYAPARPRTAGPPPAGDTAGPSSPGGDTPGRSPTPRADAARPLPVVPALGDYDLLHIAGEGGMGVVFQARHRPSGRTVALKILRPGMALSPELLLRFRREIRIADAVRHPHIAAVHETGEYDGRLYYTMPYAPSNLAAQYRRFADPRAAARLLAAVARAVYYAHTLGVIHRDLKPGNILLTADDQPLVADFGLARWVDASQHLTRYGDVMGTPAYMAPEQAGGPSDQVGPPADVWALGVMLYELLTGQRPFDADGNSATLHRVCTAEPAAPRQFRPDLDPALEAVVLKCLRKPPSERYPTAAALADDLQRWLDGWPVRAQAPPVRPAGRPAPGRPRLTRSAVTAVLLVAGPALVMFGGAGALAPRDSTAVSRPGLHGSRVATPENRQAVLELLRRGQRVPLIPERDWPLFYRRRLGRPIDIEDPKSGGATTFSSGGLSLIELAPDPLTEHFRLEARVRQRKIGVSGSPRLGLYFGLNTFETSRGPVNAYYELTYHEAVPLPVAPPPGQAVRNPVLLRLVVRDLPGRRDPPVPEVMEVMLNLDPRRANVPPAPAGADPAPERDLALEVRPHVLRAYYGGQCVGEVPARQLETSFRSLLQLHKITLTDPSPVRPRGSLGVVVANASAAFRAVTLTPLPEEK
jgi:serine/threonine-protein kinase